MCLSIRGLFCLGLFCFHATTSCFFSGICRGFPVLSLPIKTADRQWFLGLFVGVECWAGGTRHHLGCFVHAYRSICWLGWGGSLTPDSLAGLNLTPGRMCRNMRGRLSALCSTQAFSRPPTSRVLAGGWLNRSYQVLRCCQEQNLPLPKKPDLLPFHSTSDSRMC